MKQYQNKNWLENQYLILNQSSIQIAESQKTTPQCIRYWLKKYNIKRRCASDAQKNSTHPNKYRFQKGSLNPQFEKKPLKPFLKNQKPWNTGKHHKIETINKIKKSLTGKKLSDITKQKISKSLKGLAANEKNPSWKGDLVDPHSLHEYIRSHKPKPISCEICQKTTTKLELSNIDHKYRRNIDDFRWLCRSCHRKYDQNTFHSYDHFINNNKKRGLKSCESLQ